MRYWKKKKPNKNKTQTHKIQFKVKAVKKIHTIMVDVVGGFPNVRQDHVVFPKSCPEGETSIWSVPGSLCNYFHSLSQLPITSQIIQSLANRYWCHPLMVALGFLPVAVP